MRTCKKCYEEKEIKDFKLKDGFRLHTCLDCFRLSKRNERLEDPERFRGYDRKKLYGLTRETYENMLVQQEGLCYICKLPPGERSLNVDHNHNTGEVRKLLCSPCNTAIGLMKDNPELLVKAAAYLIEHKGDER